MIHVAWQDGGDPILNQDYFVSTESPASVDFPDVELREGSLTWQLWSDDEDNPGAIGDIGVITSPYAKNFAVELKSNLGAAGARDVKGIILDPQGAGSDGNYSNLSGTISGKLSGNLLLQKSSGGSQRL